MASPTLILLSPDAAGRGWFLDPTPSQDEEFVPTRDHDEELLAAPDGPAAGRVDLLTVLTHEMGHVLGLDTATITS
jgi:hypothetical protein